MDRGIRIDIAHELQEKIEKNYVIASQKLWEDYDIKDIKDTKTLCRVFEKQAEEEELKFGSSIIRTYSYDQKEKTWHTNTDIVADIAQHGNKFAINVLEVMKLFLYLQQIKSIREFVGDDGFAHPQISTSATNRVQYQKPGLLTITKPLLWNVVRPTSDDYNLYSIDIQNQEPWILINLLKIDSLKAMLSISDDTTGLYEVIYNYLYHKIPDVIERNELKKAWNALTYGASKQAVINMCKHIDGNTIYNFFKKIPNYQEYSSRMYANAHNSNNKVVKSYFGTDVRITGSSGAKRAKQMMNAGIQATGTDILAFLVQNFLQEVSKESLEQSMRLYFTRHDECVIEIAKSFEELYGEDGVIDILTDLFAHRVDDWEPFRLKVTKIVPSTEALFAVDEDVVDGG